MTECAFCYEPIVSDIHVLRDKQFCSRACAISYMTQELVEAANDVAAEIYADEAEVIDNE